MKLKSAHILAAASLATLMILVGCGTNNAGELTSPGYTLDQIRQGVSNTIISLQISPRSQTAHVGERVQLQALGVFDNGQTANVANLINWTSSDPALASVDGNGVVFAKGKGVPLAGGTVTITATSGSATDSIQFTVNPPVNRVFISNKTGNSISVFDLQANGAVNALHKISGSNTQLTGPVQMAVSVARQELFVANPGKGEIEVFYLQAEGNVAPLRHIKSANTAAVTGVAISTNDEVFAYSGGQISVYDIAAGGDAVVPKRTAITGTVNSGLVGTADCQISLVGTTEILVPNGADLRVFSQTTNVDDPAPLRVLLGPLPPVLPATIPPVFGAITTASNDGGGNMYLSDQGVVPASVMKYNTNDFGNTNPLLTLTDAFTFPAATLPVGVGGNLWVVDAAKVGLYNNTLTPAGKVRGFTSTDLSNAAGIVITGSF